jgi:large subunit ribosomal protein L14e
MSSIYHKYVEIGRVVYVASGTDEGKLGVVVNVVDGNRVLLDGPEKTGVRRAVRNFKELQLTKLKVAGLRVGQRTKGVRAAYAASDIDAKWRESAWAKKIEKQKIRASLNDFERFKVLVAKQRRNRLIRVELGKLKKSGKKSAAASKAKKPATKTPAAGGAKAPKAKKSAKQ